MSIRYYVAGRGNLACTVFAPWDCRRNCSFCTTKSMYDSGDFKLEDTLKAIDRVLESAPFSQGAIREFVISGGEPLDNMRDLGVILSRLPDSRPVYLNTTLPVESVATMSTLSKILDRVDGINVSVQLTMEDILHAGRLEEVATWKTKLRVNCVVPENPVPDIIREYVDFLSGYCHEITFRADYRNIDNTCSLKDPDAFFSILKGLYMYMGSSGCQVCNDDRFRTSCNGIVSYHRGMNLSSITITDCMIVNDIIVRPGGVVALDWSSADDPTLVEDLLARSFVNGDAPKATDVPKDCPALKSVPFFQRVDTCHGSFYERVEVKGCPYKAPSDAHTAGCGRSSCGRCG